MISFDAASVKVALAGAHSAVVSRDSSLTDQEISSAKLIHICLDQWSPLFVASSDDEHDLPCSVESYVVEHGYTRTTVRIRNSDIRIMIRSTGISDINVGASGRVRIDWSKASLLAR